jgi:hypothetical protein
VASYDVASSICLALVTGVTLYFITSSDSCSYVDDILSAQGLPNPPLVQKVYWAFTEGAVATALLKSGGSDALGALQSVSICASLPYTIAICFLCTSLWRALKIDQGEDDIMHGRQWATDSLDIFEGFNPCPANSVVTPRSPAMERLKSLIKATLAPFHGMYKASKGINGDGIRAKMDGILGFVWFILWIAFVGLSAKDGEWTCIGWSFYMFLVLHIT